MNATRCAWLLSVSLVIAAGAGLRAGQVDSKADEKVLAQVNQQTDGPALLAFFKHRTLTDTEMIQVEALIQQLGADSFAKRELATAKLIARGPVVVKLLTKYFNHKDLEISDRAKKCVHEINEKDLFGPKQLKAAVRLLAERKPAGAADVLLQYLTFIPKEQDEVSDEARKALAVLAVKDGKAEPAVVKALSDKNPTIRSAAGEALALAKDKEHEKEVWKLLDDPDIYVKFRVALGLVLAEQPKAVPVLIGMVPKLDWSQALQVEDMLFTLAGEKDAPKAPLGQGKEAREKFVKAWSDWWQQSGAKVNLSRLKGGPKILGYTVLVLLEAGQIVELGSDNEVRWQLNGLQFPLDVQVLPDDRVLVAEYNAGKVTERDLKGKVLWQYQTVSPLAAQRLDNGNTFIVSDMELLEVDKNKNPVFTRPFPVTDRVMKAVKLADGRMVCMTKGNNIRIVVLDEKGKEKSSFPITLGKHLFGGRLYMTPTGRVLVPFNDEGKVVEYDLDGNKAWEVKVHQPVAAVRLTNGNTLITTMDQPGKVIEFDRAGNEIWSYQTQGNSKITRALRR